MAEAEVIPRDDILRFNLETFLPYICECVQATDLLVHLQYFSREQRKEIFKMCGQNNDAAMRKALEILMHEKEEPGRFTAIRDAIEDSNYPKIVQMLDGEVVSCDENCRKIVELFTPEIIRRLDPEVILPSLVSRGTITCNDAEEVRAEERNHGKRRACWILLFHLPNRVEHWFRDFLEALIDCDFTDIAKILDLDLFNKIIEQRKTVSNANNNPDLLGTREHVLKDNNYDSSFEKGDLGQPEMNMASPAKENFDNEFEKKSKNCDLESFFQELDNLKLTEETACKQLIVEDVTIGKMRNKEVEDIENSLTETKLMARGGEDKRTESERWKRKRQDSPTAGTSDTQSNKINNTDVIYENNFDDVENASAEDTNEELLDFDSLLNADTNPRLQEQGSQEVVLYSRKDVDGATGNETGSVERVAEENDLDIESEPSSSDETEYNITTDVDEVDAVDVDIPLREYQKELAKEGEEGVNVIVMAPTNTGKTRVACRIMQMHLREYRHSGRIGKVIFLVENEALALQQGKVCAELLPAYRTKVISGSIQRDKKQYLRDFVNRRDIVVVTAQVLLNALKLNEIAGITLFSMIVFDECHHTDNYHRFNEIMSRYMDLKLRQNLDAGKLPQIVGLTASLGVGGNTDPKAAILHMKGLLANLDAKFLCTVRKNKEELARYENNPVEKIVAAKKRENDRYRQAILDIMDIIDEYMKSHQSMQQLSKKDEFIKEICSVPPCRGSEKFIQWLSEFKKKLAELQSDNVRRMMNPCRIHLEVYNKALLIHADARIKDAAAILEDSMEDERKINPKNDTDVFLLELYDNLKLRNFNHEPQNPKLVEMERIITQLFAVNEDARGIIFVKTRELAQALVNWMKDTESLNPLNASEFVGQVASKADGGMTKCRQKDALEYFKGGRHKIIIATSVAEEGLDITKCNLVIRYEHVTNEIVRLQSRGRARQQNSKYYVLTEEGSWIAAKEEKNALLEKVMNKVVPQLQAYIEDHPNIWEQELREIQDKQKQEEELKEEKRFANMTNDDVEFRCLNCGHFVCFLSDIRKIQDAHHVVIDEEVPKRLISARSPQPMFMDQEVKFDGVICCGNIECQRELGGVCEYKHTEFPLLKISNFRVVSKNGEGKTYKKWKKANFRVQPFTLDDLREVVERRRANI